MVHLASLAGIPHNLADDEAGAHHGQRAGEVGPYRQMDLLGVTPCHLFLFFGKNQLFIYSNSYAFVFECEGCCVVFY